MATHELQIKARGPWHSPPRDYVAANCSCHAWDLVWTREELEGALLPGQTFEDHPWTAAAEAIRHQYLQHLARVARRELERAARVPGPDFY